MPRMRSTPSARAALCGAALALVAPGCRDAPARPGDHAAPALTRGIGADRARRRARAAGARRRRPRARDLHEVRIPGADARRRRGCSPPSTCRRTPSQRYPFLIARTPYNVAPYGVDQYPASLGPSEHFQKDGFIFVYQDARGRYMSEGEFQQVRPFNPAKGPKDVDESTDTYDTIEWLLKNVAEQQRPRRHGRHLAARLPRRREHHRLASRAQGGVAAGADRRLLHGRRRLPQRRVHARRQLRVLLGVRRRAVPTPEPPRPALRFDPGTPDMYEFFLRTPVPLARMNADAVRRQGGLLAGDRRSHRPTTSSGSKRSLWQFMNGVKCAVLNVGGWFDAEDPVGPLRTYRAVEEKNPGDREHAGDGAVVARRLVARRRRHARQPELRRQDGGVLPREHPVPVLHALPEGQAGQTCPRRGCS